MNEKEPTRASVSAKAVKWLASFYPVEFRKRFGEQIEQNIDDLLCRGSTQLIGLSLFKLIVDVGCGIFREHLSSSKTFFWRNKDMLKRKVTAIVGTLLVVPGMFVIAMLIFNIEPPIAGIEAYLRPANGPNYLGSALILLFVIVMPAIGVYVGSFGTRKLGLRSDALADLIPAFMIASIMVAPFVILSGTIGRNSYKGIPYFLFGLLWLVALVMTLIAAPSARRIMSGERIFSNPPVAVLRCSVLLLLSVFWLNIVFDQMPCFLGVPNCD